MGGLQNDKRVMVCAECLRACCWYGEFMCDKARYADVKVVTVGDLRKIKAGEHEHYWSDEMFLRVYGTTKPDFCCTP